MKKDDKKKRRRGEWENKRVKKREGKTLIKPMSFSTRIKIPFCQIIIFGLNKVRILSKIKRVQEKEKKKKLTLLVSP